MSDLASLLEAAGAVDPVVRGDAGQALAAHAGSPAIDAVLVSLIQDRDNTYPTTQTALGLLARGDAIGIQVLSRALAGADEESTTHALDAMDEAIQSRQDHARLLSCAPRRPATPTLLSVRAAPCCSTGSRRAGRPRGAGPEPAAERDG